jgi:cyclic di-GMP phosphodiesterase
MAMPMEAVRVLIVDDDDKIRSLHARLVQSMGFETETAADGIEAIAKLPLGVDLILMDGDMPHMDGFEAARRIRELTEYAAIPIVMVTGLDVRAMHRRALEVGINDLVAKPVDVDELRLRATWLIELKRSRDKLEERNVALGRSVEAGTRALREALEQMTRAERKVYGAHLDTIHRLAVAAEFKDADTADHIDRVGRFAGVLASAIGLAPGDVERIRHAAPMHDVGKIGIPDEVLLKPGSLDEVEWAMMRKHTTLGAKLLEGSDSEVLQMGERIAQSHHEKWDGSGYPQGLSGSDIPLEARICAIADYFDAVTMARPYRGPLPVEYAVAGIEEDQGVHFDPALREAFLGCLPQIVELRAELAEVGHAGSSRLRLPTSLDELE